jgi:mannosyltransferase
MQRRARSGALLGLAAIVALAVFLRFLQLGHDSLWVDEAFSANIAGSGWGTLLDQAPSADPNPPLYYVLLHIWMGAFGDSEAALRSLSAVVGVALVVVVYALGRRLGGTRAGLMAALFAAVSEFFVHYSQEARVYSLLALLATSSYYFLLGLFDERGLGSVVGYVLTTTALLYAHTYGLFVFAAQIAFFLVAYLWRREWLRGQDLRALGMTLAAPLVLAIPWFVFFAGHVRDELRGSAEAKLSWLSAPSAHDLPGALSGYAGSKWALLIIALAVGAAAVLAWRGSIRAGIGRLAGDRDVVLLLFWLVVPIVVPFVISLAVTPIYQFKYTIPAAVAFYLVIALALDSLGPRTGLVAAAIVCLVFLASTARYYGDGTEDWRDATAYVAKNAHAGDTVVFDSSVGQTAFDYYWTRSDVREVVGSQFAGLENTDLATIRSTAAESHPIWLVVSHSRDPDGEIPALIAQSHPKVADARFDGVLVTRFR